MLVVQEFLDDWKDVFRLNTYLSFLHSYFFRNWTKSVPKRKSDRMALFQESQQHKKRQKEQGLWGKVMKKS
jgi:hypothetical protein